MWAECLSPGIYEFSVGLMLCFVFLAESPAEFFADNKNIAGFDNVRFICAVDLL